MQNLGDGRSLTALHTDTGPGWGKLAKKVRDYLARQGEYAFEDPNLRKALGLLRLCEMEAETPALRKRARQDLDFALRGFHPPGSVTCGRPTKALSSDPRGLYRRVLSVVREIRRDRQCSADALASRIAEALGLKASQVNEVICLLRPPLRTQRPRDAEVARILVSRLIGRGEESVRKLTSGPTRAELAERRGHLTRLMCRLAACAHRFRARPAG